MNEISLRQYGAILFLLSLGVKMFMLPALVLRNVGSSGIVVMLIYVTVEALSTLAVSIIVKKYPRVTLFVAVNRIFGKVGSKIVYALIALFLLAKCTLLISEIKMFFAVTMYEQIIWAIMILPLMVTMITVARKRLRTLGRTAELIAPIIMLSIVVLFALLVGDCYFLNLLPISTSSLPKIGKGIALFPMWLGDGVIAMLMMGKVKSGKHTLTVSILAPLIASIVVLVFSAMLFATYANISTLIDYGHNVSNMTQFSLGSQDYGRFDLLFFCVWMLSILLTLCIAYTLLTKCTGRLIGKSTSYPLLLAVLAVIYVLSTWVFNNENVLFNFLTGNVKYALILPLILPFIIAIFNRRLRREKK